jgi:hypothetical protein
MTFNKSLILSVAVTMLLTACGGSSDSDSKGIGAGSAITYSGVTTPATITSDNSEALAESGTAVTKSLTASDNTDQIPFAIVSNTQSDEVGKTVNRILNQVLDNTAESSNLPIGITEVENGSCGGTATANGTENQFQVTFNNYCDDGLTINGVMSGSETDLSSSWSTNGLTVSGPNGTMTMSGSSSCTTTEAANTYTETCTQNVQVSSNGITSNSNYTEVCIITYDPTYNEDCTETEYLQASNGQIYQVEDSYVSGSDSNGWNTGGTFYDPTYGSVYFYASNIQYCANGNIQSGSITLSDESNNFLSVTFNSCDEMTITLDGNSTTVAQ